MGATTKGYSVMSGPPNIFIILAGLLLLVAMSHASEENQIVPSNILEISPSIPEHSNIEDDQWNIMENRFMNFFPTYFGGRGFNPTYFGGRGFKKIGEGDRRKRLFGLSPFSSYQLPKARYRRPNRNVGDRLQVIRLKRNNIQDLQHLGEALKVIRL